MYEHVEYEVKEIISDLLWGKSHTILSQKQLGKDLEVYKAGLRTIKQKDCLEISCFYS